jgi:predicted  nucleic acid-binding Zn-ribbon protein
MKEIRTEEDLRAMVRELMMGNDKLAEYDALFPKKDKWDVESKKLRSDLVELLKHIEDDEYEKGSEKIDHVMKTLKMWKRKIEKRIDDSI